MAEPRPLAPGTRVDGVEIVGLLGRGGMGDVYQAFDPHLERMVAVKLVAEAYAREPEFVARFEREARAASSITHPNVAQVHALGRWGDRPYLVMEYVDGESLGEILQREGHLAGLRCLEYLRQAAEGLRAAHGKGVIHRDVKPANLMLDAAGRIRIVDFGLARRTGKDVTLTRSNLLLGTPRYMSPEQALGEELDFRSDMYALGASFYHLLGGAPPYDADTPIAVMMQHVGQPLPPLKQRNPRVPDGVCALIERMMAKRRDDRFGSYEELLAEIARLQSGRTAAAADAAPTTRLVAGRPPRLDRATVVRLGVAAAVLLVALLIAGYLSLSRRLEQALAEGRQPPAAAVRAAAPTATAAPALPTAAPIPPAPAWMADDPLAPPIQVATAPAPTATPSPHPTAAATGSNPFTMALQAGTLSSLRRLHVAVEVFFAEHGRMPVSLAEVAREQELHSEALLDPWRRPIQYRPAGPGHFQLRSAGADGLADTADDVVLEDGYVIQGAPTFPGMG